MTDPFFNRAKIFKTLTENEVIELLLDGIVKMEVIYEPF